MFFTGHANGGGRRRRARLPWRLTGTFRPSQRLSAALVMAGPGVSSGATLETASMLSLAPRPARLLGVELPAAEAPPLLEALDDRLHPA